MYVKCERSSDYNGCNDDCGSYGAVCSHELKIQNRIIKMFIGGGNYSGDLDQRGFVKT